MYFKNINNTNIDEDFNNNNLFSKIKNIYSKYKIFVFIGIIFIALIIMVLLFYNKKIENYLFLLGEENIIIYEGTDYVEPGFDAYNSKNEKLNNEVIINSNLNTKEKGNYEITYTLGEITKTRKINVVEKTKSYTYIYLNAINNDINIYLPIGSDYIEPGYKVYSNSNIDLTDKVKVTGTVDVNQKGLYKLTYNIIDSEGITISKSRMVYVMDPEINLKPNTIEIVNQDIEISILIKDEFFDYMILPDGRKISNNKYTYKISQNGKYTFKTYNKKGMEKEKTIEVSNIDKQAPTGICSGSYRNGKSNININAKDNYAINYYEINSKKYLDNKIIINGELKNVNIKIYDIAGNEKEISCKLEKEITEIDKIYTESNSYTNSVNNIRYLIYNQADPRWAQEKFSNGETIAKNGCMITSVSVVSSAYDISITPDYVLKTYPHHYPYDSINKLVNEAFDCKKKNSNDMRNTIINELKKGNIFVIMVYGSKKNGNSSFTSSQHYMALLDYKDGKIFVGNAYSSSGYGKAGWYDENKVLTSIQEVNMCTPTQKLLDKFNK